MPIKDLLVSVDRTAPSRPRLEFALALAQRFSARVTALALVPEPYLPTPDGVHIPLELVRQQLEEAERETGCEGLQFAGVAGPMMIDKYPSDCISYLRQRLPGLWQRLSDEVREQ